MASSRPDSIRADSGDAAEAGSYYNHHGILNGTVIGVARDAGYRERVRTGGLVIRAAYAITAPSRQAGGV